MMQHTSHTRTLMLDWLEDREARVLPSPSDEEIMEKFGFSGPEEARTLLADLADRGKISVRGTGVNRAITLGRSRAPVPSATTIPDRTVKKPSARVRLSEDAGVSRIMEIVGRTRATATPPLPPAPPRPPVAEPAVVEPAVESAAPAAAVEPAPAEPVVTETAAAPSIPSPRSKKSEPLKATSAIRPRQVNFRVSEAHYAMIAERADSQDIYISTLVSDMMAELLDGAAAEAPAPKYKPLIRANVIRAAREAGIPLEEFVPGLIEVGLQRFLASQVREAA